MVLKPVLCWAGVYASLITPLDADAWDASHALIASISGLSEGLASLFDVTPRAQ